MGTLLQDALAQGYDVGHMGAALGLFSSSRQSAANNAGMGALTNDQLIQASRQGVRTADIGTNSTYWDKVKGKWKAKDGSDYVAPFEPFKYGAMPGAPAGAQSLPPLVVTPPPGTGGAGGGTPPPGTTQPPPGGVGPGGGTGGGTTLPPPPPGAGPGGGGTGAPPIGGGGAGSPGPYNFPYTGGTTLPGYAMNPLQMVGMGQTGYIPGFAGNLPLNWYASWPGLSAPQGAPTGGAGGGGIDMAKLYAGANPTTAMRTTSVTKEGGNEAGMGDPNENSGAPGNPVNVKTPDDDTSPFQWSVWQPGAYNLPTYSQAYGGYPSPYAGLGHQMSAAMMGFPTLASPSWFNMGSFGNKGQQLFGGSYSPNQYFGSNGAQA